MDRIGLKFDKRPVWMYQIWSVQGAADKLDWFWEDPDSLSVYGSFDGECRLVSVKIGQKAVSEAGYLSMMGQFGSPNFLLHVKRHESSEF